MALSIQRVPMTRLDGRLPSRSRDHTIVLPQGITQSARAPSGCLVRTGVWTVQRPIPSSVSMVADRTAQSRPVATVMAASTIFLSWVGLARLANVGG